METLVGKEDFTKYMIDNPWLDRARDTIHANWELLVDIDWMTYDWGDPLRYETVRCRRDHDGRRL